MRLIDEDALIHRICEERDCVKLEHASDIGYRNGLNMAVSMILNAPTIEARPVVRGEWVQCFEDWRKQIEGDKCSVCGFEHYGCSVKHYHFCPNCGADNRGEVDA